jgi:DNA-binding NarL/FixJ family response regulator
MSTLRLESTQEQETVETPVLPAGAAARGSAPLRVLIVAGDPLARAGLAALLHPLDSLLIVGQSSDRDDARTMIETFLPEVVVLGLGWHSDRLDGLAAYAEAGAPVLTLLGSEPDAATLAGIWAAGSRGLLGRTAEGEQVAVALHALAQGLAVFDPAHAPAPPLARETPAPTLPQPVEPLTPRELEVLRGMADGLSNKLIARALGISEHTVKYHVNAILGKLEAQSRTEAVVRATRAGLLLL